MSKPRHVMGLKTARMMPDGPFKQQPKLRGKAAEGIRFQRKVVEALAPLEKVGTVLSDQWIQFSDTYGTHWCQFDAAVDTHDRILVVEAKLSLRRLPVAIPQLMRLYKPCLEHIFQKPVVMLVAFQHFVIGAQDKLKLVDEPEEMLYTPLPQLKKPLGWHLIGV